ncbi:MAG: hypothetical protein ACLSTO_03285 [Bilophila wadsworthia]
MAIYEIMPVSDALKRLIVDKADANVLGRAAVRSHAQSAARRHVEMIAGLTSRLPK